MAILSSRSGEISPGLCLGFRGQSGRIGGHFFFHLLHLKSLFPLCPPPHVFIGFTHLLRSFRRAPVLKATAKYAHAIHSLCVANNLYLFSCYFSFSLGRILELVYPLYFVNEDAGAQKGERIHATLPIKSVEYLRPQTPILRPHLRHLGKLPHAFLPPHQSKWKMPQSCTSVFHALSITRNGSKMIFTPKHKTKRNRALKGRSRCSPASEMSR